MTYARIHAQMQRGELVLLDGGIGTELQRRGVAMDDEAWCGIASLHHGDLLEAIHVDYIRAGADVITANTYASSRLILEAAGLADRYAEINHAAVAAAKRAREASGRDEVLIAGSLSHRGAVVAGTARPDLTRAPTAAEMAAAFGEQATLLRDAGCDLIILEMMYYPERMAHVFEAALATGLPVWAGFSVRRGDDGQVLSFAPEPDIPFAEIVQVLDRYPVAAAGIMHSSANVIGDALKIVRDVFGGPLMAYPDSGYFTSPDWQFEDIIPPQELCRFTKSWIGQGVQIAGGCCGLSPEHITALAPLKQAAHAGSR